jgi:hypothetical protein
MRNSFQSQIYFVLRDICHTYQAPAQLTAQKKISSFINLSCHQKKQKNHRSTWKLRGVITVRRLICSFAWELSFSSFRELRWNCVAVCSICATPFSSTYSTQCDNNSRKLRLRCGCQFFWCAPALNVSENSALQFQKRFLLFVIATYT